MSIKRTKAIAVGVAAALLFAGCTTNDGGNNEQSNGAEGSTSGSQETVTMWMYPVVSDEAVHKEYWDGVIDAFETENPGIKVEYEIFPWADRDAALQTAIASKTAPDLVYLIPDQLAAYQDNIEPIDPYLGEEQLSDILDNVKESVTLNGQMLGLPILTTANPLLCNASVFEEAGVTEYPTTWEDFKEMSPAFVEKGLYALAYVGSAAQTLNMSFYPLIWQAGGNVYAEGGEDVAFNGPEGVESLEFLMELNEMGAMEPDIITTDTPLEQTGIAQGKTACAWNYAYQDIAAFWDTDDMVVLPPLMNKESVSYGTVGSLAMLKDAKNKEAAGKFAEFAGSGAIVVPMLETAGFFSAVKSTGELYADDPILSKVEENVGTATVGELYSSSRAIQGVLIPEIQAALLGQKSAQEALDAAAAAARPLLNQ